MFYLHLQKGRLRPIRRVSRPLLQVLVDEGCVVENHKGLSQDGEVHDIACYRTRIVRLCLHEI